MAGYKDAKSVLLRHKPNWKDLPLVDSGKDMVVSVRKREVDNANRMDPDSCAIALACERMGFDAVVYQSTTYVCDGKQIRRFTNSGELTHELKIFDETDGFTPGPYVLLAPPASRKLGLPHKSKAKHKVPTRRRRPVTLSVRRFE